MSGDESVTITIEAPEGGSDTISIPAGLLDALAEEGDTTAEVVGDVAVIGFAGRAHAIVHHAEGDPADDLLAAEGRMMELFEERFGVTYAEATGHSH